MPITVLTATIAAGESVSSAIDLIDGTLLRMRTPDEWTPANMSFLMAPADVAEDYRDVILVGGREMLGMWPHAVIVFAGDFSNGFREGFLKIRSGTAKDPIAQAATRTFSAVILR